MSTAMASIEMVETSLPAVLDIPLDIPEEADKFFDEMDGHLGDLRARISELAVAIEAYRSEFDRLDQEVKEFALTYGFTLE